MKYYTGLDVSLELTSVCIVDETGDIVFEGKVDSDPEVLCAFFARQDFQQERIVLEAGPLSQWLYGGMAEAGYPVICAETRHMKAALSAQMIKTDRNDARGIAQMGRVGLYKPVHVKTIVSQEKRCLLTARKFLLRKLMDTGSEIRALLRNFGLKVGTVSRQDFEHRTMELLSEKPELRNVVCPLLNVRQTLFEEFNRLHALLLEEAKTDPVCRRLMTMPGVGPVAALTFRCAVDVPARFARSRNVGVHFGLTPRRYQSGEVDYSGRISKTGDAAVREALYAAAHSLMTRGKAWSSLRAWAMQVAKRKGMAKAKVALARKMAVVLHRMWRDGTEFQWSKQVTEIKAV